MTTPAGMLRKLEAYDLITEVVKILNSDKKILEQANADQWRKGKRSTGNPIGKYRNGKYAMMKNQMNPEAGAGQVDLMLSKKTVNSLTTDITADSIIFKLQSDEWDLQGRYGENILGLNSESRIKFIKEKLLPELLLSFTQKTGMA
jgi:uncharacterized membrane protein YvbJ